MAERIKIDQLKAGMVITCITAQNGPVKIRKSGLVTSQDMVTGLAEMGVLEVEIDPAQTVEIDPPTPTESHTRQLLTGERREAHSLDHALSDQFNRSLFLPSAQGLPSVWQHYGKKSLSAAVVLVGGFALGWVLANWQAYVGMLSAPQPIVSVPAPVVTSEADNAETVAPEPEQQTPDVAQVEPVEQQDEPISELDAALQNGLVLGVPPEDSAQLSENNQAQGQASEPEPVISDELLRRFNQAVAELDNEPAVSEPVRVRNNDEIPRVDQLPVRLLTRLPSMSFNAHMYASNPMDRWVRVNGIRLVEGEWLDNELQLVEIEPQHVVLAFQGEPFRMAALSDW